jgi:GntR family transcriptional regulator
MRDTAITALTDPTMISAGESPLYVEIYRLLRRKIASGDWKLGDQLPALETMAGDYGVTRVTLRKAIGLLERDGIVRCRQGKGSYVSAEVGTARFVPSAAIKWADMVGSSSAGCTKKLEPSDKKTLPQPDEMSLKEFDGAQMAESYVRLYRVSLFRDEPVVLSDTFLDTRLYKKRAKEFEQGSILPIIASIDSVVIKRGFQFLTIGTADIETARHLNIRINAPIGETNMWLIDSSNTVIYGSHHSFPSDFVKFRFDMALE